MKLKLKGKAMGSRGELISNVPNRKVARGIEQLLIDWSRTTVNGSDNLINSISPKKVQKFKDYVDAAYIWLKDPKNAAKISDDFTFNIDDLYNNIKTARSAIWR